MEYSGALKICPPKQTNQGYCRMTQNERLATIHPVKHLTSRIPKRIAAVGIVATLGFLAIAAYAMFVSLPGHIKVAPVSIVVHSASSLPAEVQALEAQTAALLFDRDTATAHLAYADQSIDIQLERQTEIKSINIYGPSPYELTVKAQQGSTWNTIAGLDKIKLTSQPAAWNSFPATQAVTTGALRFVLSAPPGNSGGGGKGKSGKGTTTTSTATVGGIPEIEIWATGEHALLNGAALVAAMPSGTTAQSKPAQARSYTATPVSAVIGKDGQSFRFTLDRPTNRFKRAWLSYEAYGLSHWVSPVRRINGLSVQGGSFTFSGSDWTPLTEPIHPDWLVTGSNRVDFSLPENIAGNYSVRNVRVIAELDDGNNFIARATSITGATANKAGTEIDAPVLNDGDLTTGWSPYADPRNKTGQPALTLTFEKPTQLDTLSLNLVNALSGTMSVDLLVAGQWQSAGLPTINGKKLTAGWNNLSGFAQVPADALRITFLNGSGSPVEIREVAASGSGTGTAYVPSINVAYPDAGQFYGREAYIRGFLSVPDNGSGPAAVAIAGKSIATPDGSFGLVVSKEDAGYASQADAEPWQVEVAAIYPDGQKLTQIVKLTQAFDASKAHGKLPNAVNPVLLVLGDASLEIAPDATEEGVKIKITPLSEKDLPRLDPGMTNVTRGPHKGYRFTPSPYKFKKNIKVTLPFDAAFVPQGHVENDIKTYYFDTQAGHWVPLDRVLVDGGKKRITSLTNHFTDMINATLTVPDHPEAVSFNPTQLKDIKAADPGAGINLIEPPQANNNGDARLSYPIEIPQGRQGMQPQLAISYNSAGGNGWLGQGWDLSVPSISIETRWGVPRYDEKKESETYLLNGEQLVPLIGSKDGQPGTMPHRIEWEKLKSRSTGDQYFVTRVEGAFRQIVRHGTSPANYWWEVTDKNGVKNYYGGANQDDESGKLGSSKGVFKWMLKRTQDANGNYVEYNFDKVCDTGTGTGVCNTENYVNGYQLYLSNIGYTRKGTETAPYTVSFIRETARRTDINIDARGGFKQVTASRLRQIDIEYDGKLIRRYKTEYRYGTFAKSLLTTIVQSGSNGEEFNRHAFDYYNDMPYDATSQSYAGFAGGVDWIAQKDGVKLNLAGIDFESSLVGANQASSEGSSGMIGLAFASTENAIGVSFNSNSSESSGVLQMIDVDGDGLPDKVYQKEGKGPVYYRRNTWIAGQDSTKKITFGESKELLYLDGISHSSSSGSAMGIDGRFGGGVGYFGSGSSLTNDKMHLADINGDGLIDVVTEGGLVKFSGYESTVATTGSPVTPDLNSESPTFDMRSSNSPAKISTAGNSAKGMLPDLTATYTSILNRNPLLDVVKRWEAPWSGTVHISGTVMLKDSRVQRASKNYKTADGVTVAIEKNGSVLWSKTIPIEDEGQQFDAGTPADITVNRGDRLYFRVKSRFDGKYDEVAWVPRVTYTNAASLLDVNNRDVYRYDAAEDFTLAGRIMEIQTPYRGKVRFAGILKKLAQTTDDVRFELTRIQHMPDPNDSNKVVEKSRQTMVVKRWNAAEISDVDLETIPSSADLPLFPEVEVNKGDSLVLRFRTDSNIDIQAIDWSNPRLYYTEAWREGGSYNMPDQMTTAPIVDDNTTGSSLKPGSSSGAQASVPPGPISPLADADGPIYNLPTSYNIDTYPFALTDLQSRSELTQPQRGWTAPRDGVLIVTPWVALKTYENMFTSTQYVNAKDGDIAFTVKRHGEHLGKGVVKVRSQQIQGNGYDNLMLVQVNKGDELFFDVSVRDSTEPANEPLKDEISKAEFRLHYASNTSWQAPFSDNVKVTPTFNGYGSNDTVPLYSTGAPLPTGKVIFLVRQGTTILARQDFVMGSEAESYTGNVSLPVKANDGYSFEIFTASNNIEINNATVWTRYPGAAPWVPPVGGAIELHPKLTFKSGSNTNGTFTLQAYDSNNHLLGSRDYAVSNGSVADSGSPLTISGSAGAPIRFEYRTSQHLLSTDLAQRPQIRMDYANKIVWKAPSSWFGLFGTKDIDVTPQPVFDFAGNSVNGTINFAIWRGTEKLAQTSFSVSNGQLTLPGSPLRLNISSGDELNFVFSSSSLGLMPYLKSQTAKVQLVGSTVQPVAADATFNFTGLLTEASAFHILMPHLVARQDPQASVMFYSKSTLEFPLPYRGWSVAGYNGNNDSCLQKSKLNIAGTCTEGAIDESKLILKTAESSFTRTRVETVYLAVPETTISPSPVYKHWRTIDPQWSVQAGSMTSSRMGGVDYVNIPQASEFAAEGAARRVPRIAQADYINWGGGYGVVANFGNTNPSQGVLDMLDLNGDRYPDVVGSAGIMYSLPDGAMDDEHGKSGEGYAGAVRSGKSDSYSISQGPARHKDDQDDDGKEGKSTPPSGDSKTPERSDLTLTGSFGMAFNDSQHDLMDINGDGLPDRVRQESGHLKVALNLGYGFAPEEKWEGDATITQSGGMNVSAGFSYPIIKPPANPYSTPSGSFSGGMSLSGDISNTTKQMADINGDGLPDNVYNSYGKLFVGFNTGSGFLEAKEWKGAYTGLRDSTSEGRSFSLSANVSASIYIPFPILTVVGINLTFGHSWSQTIAPQQVGLRDMNGDGLPDSIKSDSESTVSVALNKTGKTNLLKQVRRPLGARFEIDYIRTGNTYNQPQSKYVMAEVRVFDGVANDTPTKYTEQGSDWQRHSYAYENGQYDRFERDFLGYQTVTSYQHDTKNKHGANQTAETLKDTPVYRKTMQQYSNSHVYDKGLLLRETLFDGSGQPYIETVNKYEFWKLGDSLTSTVEPLNLDRSTARASATLFPRLTRTVKSFYEGKGTAGQSSYTEHGYDALGNVTDFTEGGSAVDPVSAHITYTSCDNSYIVGKPKLITVNTSAGEVRRREGDYFDCITGNLSTQRAFIDASRNADTKFTWDGYGNLFTIEGPANHKGDHMMLVYKYDKETNTYPIHVDNIAYGISSSASYDPKWGKPLVTTDTNGNEISYQYDSVGRTKSVLGPQEKSAGKPWTINFTYVPYLNTDATATSKESYAKTEHADRSVNSSGQVSYKADTIDTVLFTDGTKRVLQTKKDASVSAGNGTAAQDMMIVSGRVAVDALGRAIAQYYPTASTKGGSDLAFLKTVDETAKPTVTDYDVMDRASRTTLPDDTSTAMQYDFGTDAFGQPRFSTTVTDANGNIKQSFRDVRELITSVVEENRTFGANGLPSGSGKTKIATKYVYDPLKQIKQVIDYNGNITNVSYDNLGRRTVIDNPDTGRTETVYDDASNPIKKITANLSKTRQAIEYDYDHSRLIAIRHPLYPDANVTYTYGTDADRALNQAGRVKTVKHQSGSEIREYGSLGEVVKETIILTAAANGGSNPPSYTTQYDFDSFGRLHKLMMPDGETITNHYDSGGNLNEVNGTLNGRPYQYLERLDYDRFESRVYLKVGNGVETSYSYDKNNRRLANLKAGSPGKNAMQDMTYGYDNVGNISSLIDSAPIPKTNEYGGKLTQNFHYDDLYRLVKADGEYTTAREVQNYQFAMAYDAIHNITHKTQTHTVAKIGGTPRIEAATTYDWGYSYKDRNQTQPHAPTHIGDRSFDYDANGNQIGWQNDDNGSRRVIVWDEENRIREVQDPKHGASFTYNDQGERKLKKSQYGETAYINQFFTVRNGAIASTHVYAGTSRIVTKVGAGTPVGKSTPADLNGTGNLSLTAPTGGDIVVGDNFTVGTTATPTATTTSPTTPATGTKSTAASSTTAASTATTSGSSSFPGQGNAHRSDRANEVARNTEKNKHLNGGNPGGYPGSSNSNAGGNGNAAGTSNNPGNTGSTGGGNTGGSNEGGNGGGGAGSGSGGNTNGGGGAGQGNGREFIFFYHPDHLGSTGYVTDEKALRYEHINYFPFGETWVQESNATWRVPYQFTSKEMDQETGLYYFGARYYDPRTSVWQSADPILGKYLPGAGKSVPNKLVGMGGAFNPMSFAMYTYAGQNPVKYVDPDGNSAFEVNLVGIGVTVGTDSVTGQPFYKTRVGFAGIGVKFFSSYSFTESDHTKMVGDCNACDARADTSGASVSAGISAGIGLASFELKAVEWSEEFTNIKHSNDKVDSFKEVKPLAIGIKGEVNLASTKDDGDKSGGGKNKATLGLSLDLGATIDSGALLPWSDLNSNVKTHRDQNYNQESQK
jgi:RHS repeat-associated protein